MTADTEHDYRRWLAFGRVKGLGCVRFKKLAARFSDPTAAFSATSAELAGIEGFDDEIVDAVLNFSAWDAVERELQQVKRAGAVLVPLTDDRYPARLRTIADPPPVLYVKGELSTVDDKAIAVVGSRSASEYGRRVARNLCRELAGLGFTIVSGMARGVDGAAHEAALAAGGRTIAVLGSGVDRPYPPEHGKLYQNIIARGAVVSELPMGTGPLAFNFPARNRLISGVTLGTVVVEATEKSGSLITAALALDQGREVFAVPGEVGASRSRGTHRLIRQGAKLVESAADIVEEIAPQLVARAKASGPPRPALPATATEQVRRVWDLLQDRTVQIDEVIASSGFTPAVVSEVLLELELQGLVRQLPGKRYCVE